MSKKIVILIIVAVVLLLGLIGGGFFMIWSQMNAIQMAQLEDEEEEDEDAIPAIGPIFKLQAFVVNLSGDKGKRYLRTTMDLELRDELVSENVQRRLPQIRDAILMILPAKTMKEITQPEGKVALRTEIIEKLNELLGTDAINNVYFSEFVVQ
ncbi:MAG: flagellar basal body protein FliL [Desulfobacterales bacterium]|nr:flagellar basal body protein FliL [Desulfobacterales bacterium]